MIGKPEWFKYRTFGWGVAPKTWQGWVYVIILAFVLGGITAMGFNNAISQWLFAGVIAIVIIDVFHIMLQLSKVSDERENYHQLIIERNCSFAAIIALVGIALYQTYQNRALFQTGINTSMPFDWSIAVVLGAMLAAKIGSTLYVKMKM